ncbi:MAG: IS1 family transposase [Bacilli bacterium]|nr:IS1 family transposase [Bacilli bacterium]
MFSLLEQSEDFYEVKIIERIKDDYDRFHKHDFIMFEGMISTDNIQCPRCGSSKYISHGRDKNGSKRYRCKECSKTFNAISNSLFFSSKVNIKAWFAFLESLLSGTSVRAACIVAKVSYVTGSEWLNKIFMSLKYYQDEIVLDKEVLLMKHTYMKINLRFFIMRK